MEFISYAQMKRGKGLRLLKILTETAPEVFGTASLYVAGRPVSKKTLNDDLSGLFVKRHGTSIVCVAVLHDCVVDRIYTLPHVRRKGHARQLLTFFHGVSLLSPFSFLSPVEPDLIPLFLSARWTLLDTRPNKDGTRDMLSNPKRWAPSMDMGHWLLFLEQNILT